MSTHILLLTSLVAISILVLVSQKLRSWADIICFGITGLFVHSLLMQSVKIEVREWNVLSASLFVLSFSVMRWSSLRNYQQTDAGGPESLQQAAQRNEWGGFEKLDAAVNDNRMQTLGLMNAQLVHELSHPIATMTLKVDDMKRRLANADVSSLERSLVSLQRQLSHMTALLEPIRAYANNHQPTVGGFVPMEQIFELTRDLCDVVATNRGVRVSWPTSIPAIEVAGGLTLQAQVLVNLLKNAIDAVAEQKEGAHRWVNVELNEKGGNVEIVVSNGGPAVSPVHRSHLFKPFFTTKKTGKGMGLGLAVCRELVESVGGDIWYDEHSRTPRFVVRYSYLPSIERERLNTIDDDVHHQSDAA